MKPSNRVFSSKAVTPEGLQAVLWETLQRTRNRKLKPADANVIINAAKEICNISRLELQYRVMGGGALGELQAPSEK